MLFDGAGDYITSPNSADYHLSTNDFCVDGWIYMSTLPPSVDFYTILAHYDQPSSQRAWIACIRNDTGTYQMRLFYTDTGSTVSNLTNNFGSAPTTGIWHHFAFTRSSDVFRTFWDGVQVGTDQALTTDIRLPSGVTINIGGANNTPTNLMNGSLDDVRLTIGAARYTANFTPPTQAFPNS